MSFQPQAHPRAREHDPEGKKVSMSSMISGCKAWMVKSYLVTREAREPSSAKLSKALCTNFSFHPWMGLPSRWILRWIHRNCFSWPLSLSPFSMIKSQPASCSSSFCEVGPVNLGFLFSALKEKCLKCVPPSCSKIHWNPLLAFCLLRVDHAISWPVPLIKRMT